VGSLSTFLYAGSSKKSSDLLYVVISVEGVISLLL
jgi:hypothetical protein